MLLFISDLHLDASRPQIAEAFFHFLINEAPQAEALYILGDLFELWVGDDDDDPFVLDVQSRLKQLSQNSSTQVYFMHGNRDFLIGDAFAERSGCILLEDPTVINVDGNSILLMHGDLLCTKDEAYQAFRKERSHPSWAKNVMAMTLPQRRALGAQLRQQSKSMSSRKADDIMDVSEDAVIEYITNNNATKLIHGHTHRPHRHTHSLPNGNAVERIVLGDWDSQGWSLKYDGEWILDSWEINSSSV